MLRDKLVKDDKRGQTSMLSNKRGYPRRTNVGLDQVSKFHWIGVWTTHRIMHEHVGKHAKMQRSKQSQMDGTKQPPRRLHPCSKCPCSTRVHAMTKETSQQTNKETSRRKAC